MAQITATNEDAIIAEEELSGPSRRCVPGPEGRVPGHAAPPTHTRSAEVCADGTNWAVQPGRRRMQRRHRQRHR